MSWSRRQRCQHGQRQSWLEKKTSSTGAWPGRPLADRHRSRVAEATSRADVLGGQLAEASGCRPSCLLGPDPWRRPWRRWPGRGADVVLRSGDPPTALPSEARSDFAEGGVDAEGAAAPPPSRAEPAGSVYLVVCVCFLRPPRPKHTVVVLQICVSFPLVLSIWTYLSVTELFVRARVTFHRR
jgi:hypothetical protein